MMTRWMSRLLVVCGALFALSGCGGGGGGGGSSTPAPPAPTAPPAAPVVNLGFGIKQLQFSWPAASGASYYQLLENPDGVTGYSQVGSDISSTSVTQDIALHKVDWLNASYIVQACNSLGCTQSSPIAVTDGAVKAIGYVKSPTPVKYDRFGTPALSSDGNTLVVGATNVNSGGAMSGGTGAVYVYVRTSAVWSLQKTLVSPNPDATDYFGQSVALSGDGNTLVVGAPYEDGSGHGINPTPDNNAANTGAVYIFTRSGTTWSSATYVKASDTAVTFGYAVAMSNDGNSVAVGAPNNANGGNVYLFHRNSGVWSQFQLLTGTNTAAGDRFGWAVSMSSDGLALVVGAPFEDSSTTGVGSTPNDLATDAGAVYAFSTGTVVGGSMMFAGYIKAFNTDAGDNFGSSVALEVNATDPTHLSYWLFVGAPSESSGATGICVYNNTACITAQADNSVNSAGAVYLYAAGASGTGWSPISYLKASNPDLGDLFGMTLALSRDETLVAVGAGGEAGNSSGVNGADNNAAYGGAAGAVYTFKRSTTVTWAYEAYVKASNPESSDAFNNIALSGDGSTLAVGATGEGSGTSIICATGDATCAAAQADNSAAQAGAVYLY